MKKSIDSQSSSFSPHSQYEEYLESIVDTISESLLILDKDLRVTSANRTFYEYFKVHPKQTEQVLVYELGNGQWNISELRTLLEKILRTHTPFENYRVEYTFPKIGRKVMLLNARQIKAKGKWKDRILLAIEDITQFDKDRQETELGIEREQTIQEELKKSETKFHTLTALAPVGIFMTDPMGNCLYVNEKWEEIAGMSQKKALGEGWVRALHPSDKERVFTAWYEAAKHNKEFRSEYRFKTKKGKVSWVEGTAVAFRVGDKITGYIGTISDITARKKAEESYQKSEEKLTELNRKLNDKVNELETLIEFVPMGIGISEDPECTKINVNKVFREMLRLPHGQNASKTATHDAPGFKVLRDGKELAGTELPMQKAGITGKPVYNDELDILHQDGSVINLLSSAIPIYDEKKQVRIVVGAFLNITDRRKLEAQKDEFLGIASHELKTPVTSIKAYGQVLQTIFRKKGDIQAVESLQKMDAQVNKLTNLIGDLLDVTKIQSGRLEFHEEFFDFNELVNEIVDEMQLTTERHTLEKELGKTRSIFGDRDRIGQVLTNLLTNAIKYSPHTGVIQISSTADKEKVKLCVKDYGVGIPSEKQDKIFEQFFRVSGPKHNTVPGLGLGLYISSEIVKRQDGRIWVESAQGKGSTFCFSLPIQHSPRKTRNKLVNEEIQHE